MFERVNYTPEWRDVPTSERRTETILDPRPDYERWPADRYSNKPSQLSERQANFYRNLIGLALAVGSSHIPVDFTDATGARRYLDKGCVAIAAHAGFIEPLRDDAHGVVSEVSLAWRIDGTSALREGA